MEALEAGRVVPLLAGAFGRPYLYAERCPSTQRVLAAGRATLPEGALAVCDAQTEGRGRLGRRWEAPPGAAILCSLLLRPPPTRRAAELALVGGLAAAETVERATARAAALKWPNDVLLDGRKVAGVLAEAGDGAVVLGIGLNVNQDEDELPPRAPIPAGSLRASDGRLRDRAPVLADLVGTLERLYVRWRDEGLAPLVPALAERDYLRGRRVAVPGAEGVGAGIDTAGRLLVDTAAGRRAVESGEVTVGEPL